MGGGGDRIIMELYVNKWVSNNENKNKNDQQPYMYKVIGSRAVRKNGRTFARQDKGTTVRAENGCNDRQSSSPG